VDPPLLELMKTPALMKFADELRRERGPMDELYVRAVEELFRRSGIQANRRPQAR
jgi:hypothetical protein